VDLRGYRESKVYKDYRAHPELKDRQVLRELAELMAYKVQQDLKGQQEVKVLQVRRV
jgi:hypothetical protein